MIGVPVVNGFTYDQQSIPTGTIPTGATWRQRNSANVPIRERVWDGNCWRISGGLDGITRSINPASSNALSSGAVSNGVISTEVRRVTSTLGGAGATRILFNSINHIVHQPMGGVSDRFNVIDWTKPIEVLIRIRLQAANGIFRFYLTQSNINFVVPVSDPTVRSIGVVLDLSNGSATGQLHDGTSLFTQALTTAPISTTAASPLLDIALVWDGTGRFGTYFNNSFAGAINQAITNQANQHLLVAAGYEQSGGAAQTLDIFHVESRGQSYA